MFYSVFSSQKLALKTSVLHVQQTPKSSTSARGNSTNGYLCEKANGIFSSQINECLFHETLAYLRNWQDKLQSGSVPLMRLKHSQNWEVLSLPINDYPCPWLASFNRRTSVKFICSRCKSQHLFDQIRSFKTTRRGQDITGSSGLVRRMKNYLGGGTNDLVLNDAKIREDLLKKVEKDLENNALGRNGINQSLFLEGYLFGKEMHHKTNSKTFFFFVSGVFAAGLILAGSLILLGSKVVSIIKEPDITLEVIESKTKFTDVKGAYEAKEELKNIVEFLKNPEKFSSVGGELPKGVLIVGPPGTGKTLLAKAVAGEAGVPFFNTSGSEFDEIFVGVGAKRVRELFKVAKDHVPCVIFIDEIDSIGKARTSSSLHPHANDTLNQLLSEMDGFRNSGGIIVIGATNRKEDLDVALLRPGRFDAEVTVTLPDFRGRKELFEYYLSHVKHQDVDIEKLSRGTTNFTGADIKNMVNQAALRAATIGTQYVTTDLLEHARDKALMGPESLSKISDVETNKITAYHESGHTVVAYFTKNSQPLHKVTIIARGSSLGHTAYIPDKDVYHVTKTQLLAMLDAMMGGRAAEELIFGSDKVTSGASSDLEKATELASMMVRRWGMSEEVGLTSYRNQGFISPQTSNLIDKETKKLLQESYERAKDILIKHKDKHKELSEALLKYETLNADEIATILGAKPE